MSLDIRMSLKSCAVSACYTKPTSCHLLFQINLPLFLPLKALNSRRQISLQKPSLNSLKLLRRPSHGHPQTYFSACDIVFTLLTNLTPHQNSKFVRPGMGPYVCCGILSAQPSSRHLACKKLIIMFYFVFYFFHYVDTQPHTHPSPKPTFPQGRVIYMWLKEEMLMN